MVLAPIMTVMEKYENGMKGFRCKVINEFLRQYTSVEKYFATGMPREDTVRKIKEDCGDDAESIYRILLAHKQHKTTSQIVRGLIEYIGSSGIVPDCEANLREILTLEKPEYSAVVLPAREVLFAEVTMS